MTSEDKQLKTEIQHIFDSGANEVRVFNMVKNWIDQHPETWRFDMGYNDGYRDGSHGKEHGLDEMKKPRKIYTGLL